MEPHYGHKIANQRRAFSLTAAEMQTRTSGQPISHEACGRTTCAEAEVEELLDHDQSRG